MAPDGIPQGGRIQNVRRLTEAPGLPDEIRRAVPQQAESGLQSRGVRRDQQGAEEGQQAPDSRVLQKVLPSADDTGDVVVAEALLDQFQLPVGAAEHRDVGEGPGGPLVVQGLGVQHIHAAGHAADLLGDEHRLGKAVRRLHPPHRRTGGAVRDQYPVTAGVLTDHRQGCLQNSRGRAVVVCQTDLLYISSFLFEAVKAPAVRAPEAVDGLVRVPDDEEVQSGPAPGADQLVLDGVHVLELIHQQVAEPALPGGVQLQRLGQQIVEVQSAQLPEPGLIGAIQCRVRAPVLQAALHPGHRLEKLPGTALFPGGPEDLPGDGQGVAGADDPHVSQQLPADGVEGADGHGGHRTLSAQAGLQTLPHLIGGLIGEGDGGDLSGLHAPLLHQPGDPLR